MERHPCSPLVMMVQVRDWQEMGIGRDRDDGKDVTITDVNDVTITDVNDFVINVESFVIQDMKCPPPLFRSLEIPEHDLLHLKKT